MKDLFEHLAFISIFIPEGKSAEQHDIENHSTAPSIYLGTIISNALHYFRRCVVWRTTRCCECHSVYDPVAETEVGDLQVLVLVEEQVFQLDVPVGDTLSMGEGHSRGQLPEESLGFLFL